MLFNIVTYTVKHSSLCRVCIALLHIIAYVDLLCSSAGVHILCLQKVIHHI